jgi:DNA-binding GntR family transcriptional regulator
MYCQASWPFVVRWFSRSEDVSMTGRQIDKTHRGNDDGRGGKTKAAHIADELREAIATGVIAQGTRLHQIELAGRFATSITPVREALRQLQAEGLVEGQSHRGVTVASPDLEQITSIYVLRRLVEPYAAQRAALRLSRQDFARAREINRQLLEAQQSKDQLAARHLNHEFHFVFYHACGLPTVVAEIERLWATFPWTELQLHVVRDRESIREHSEILDAVVEDDQPAIQERFEAHLLNGYAALMEHLGYAGGSDPFEIGSPSS